MRDNMIKRVAAALGGGVAGGAAVWIAQSGSFSLRAVGMTYDQLAATLLAAAALVVAIFGVIGALLAFWGFLQIKEAAEKAAREAAFSKVEESLNKGELRKHVEKIVLGFLSGPGLPALLEQRAKDEAALKTVDMEDEYDGALNNVDEGWRQSTEGAQDAK